MLYFYKEKKASALIIKILAASIFIVFLGIGEILSTVEAESNNIPITQLAAKQNRQFESLYVPTHFTKINNKYFIVDCYHHRVIYSSDLNKPVSEWDIIDHEFTSPHSISFGKGLYVVDNTGSNQIVVFDNQLKKVQVIENVGKRPHRTIYNENNGQFYIISSETQEIFCYRVENKKLVENYRKKLAFLDGKYIRSIKIIDNLMYFPGTNGKIVVADHLNNYTVKKIYELPEQIRSPQDIERINGSFYISFYANDEKKRIVKVKSLEDIQDNHYESIAYN